MHLDALDVSAGAGGTGKSLPARHPDGLRRHRRRRIIESGVKYLDSLGYVDIESRRDLGLELRRPPHVYVTLQKARACTEQESQARPRRTCFTR